jgi:hypothetical protein
VREFLDSLPAKAAQREIERAEAYRMDYFKRRLKK